MWAWHALTEVNQIVGAICGSDMRHVTAEVAAAFKWISRVAMP